MRGKAIEQVTAGDVARLVTDGAAEGRRLEFKEDVPVSAEEQKVQRKADPFARPVDRSWTKGSAVAKFGRDAIAEEVVAFANADGGTLVLGMEETSEAPARAKAINPLPDVAGLERRLRDALFDCVEPRLPYLAVKAIPTSVDGSGVVLIETGPSVLGPHWVSTTRRPTIRREDRCDPLSMSEVHEMVLRRARSLDTSLRKLDEERAAFAAAFGNYVRRRVPSAFLGADRDLAARVWLRESGQAALGGQVTIVPHFDLSLPRLEGMKGLSPAVDAIRLLLPSGPVRTKYLDAYASYVDGYVSRILGGLRADQTNGFDKSVRAMRDGRVVVSFKQIRETRSCTCTADLVVGAAGFAIGLYDRLRDRGSYPAAPASVTLDLHSIGHVGVETYAGVGLADSHGRLEEAVAFPIYGFGDRQDVPVLLGELASDLMNAGGLPASFVPEVKWNDPR